MITVSATAVGIPFNMQMPKLSDTLPNGLKDVSTYPNLIAELQNRGYSTNDIQKILGGNFARVWREVEEYARNN